MAHMKTNTKQKPITESKERLCLSMRVVDQVGQTYAAGSVGLTGEARRAVNHQKKSQPVRAIRRETPQEVRDRNVRQQMAHLTLASNAVIDHAKATGEYLSFLSITFDGVSVEVRTAIFGSLRHVLNAHRVPYTMVNGLSTGLPEDVSDLLGHTGRPTVLRSVELGQHLHLLVATEAGRDLVYRTICSWRDRYKQRVFFHEKRIRHEKRDNTELYRISNYMAQNMREVTFSHLSALCEQQALDPQCVTRFMDKIASPMTVSLTSRDGHRMERATRFMVCSIGRIAQRMVVGATTRAQHQIERNGLSAGVQFTLHVVAQKKIRIEDTDLDLYQSGQKFCLTHSRHTKLASREAAESGRLPLQFYVAYTTWQAGLYTPSKWFQRFATDPTIRQRLDAHNDEPSVT